MAMKRITTVEELVAATSLPGVRIYAEMKTASADLSLLHFPLIVDSVVRKATEIIASGVLVEMLDDGRTIYIGSC